MQMPGLLFFHFHGRTVQTSDSVGIFWASISFLSGGYSAERGIWRAQMPLTDLEARKSSARRKSLSIKRQQELVSLGYAICWRKVSMSI
jgi:hypothetical protein